MTWWMMPAAGLMVLTVLSAVTVAGMVALWHVADAVLR
mgnify:CR=1 FL=1